MKIFNFGALEIVFILIIMIIFLGPGQVATLAGNLGRFIRKITRSEFWVSIWQTSREIRNLPKTLAAESGLQESLEEIQQTTNEIRADVDDLQKELKAEQKYSKEEIEKAASDLRKANQEVIKRTTTGNRSSKIKKNSNAANLTSKSKKKPDSTIPTLEK